MKRREFLRASLTAVSGAIVASKAASASNAESVTVTSTDQVSATDRGGLYHPNLAPLKPAAFQRLPPGSITPKGWLKHQLDLQADGLNGRMPEISDYLQYETNGWVDSSKDAWEELPYWLRGFADLGYVFRNQRVIDLSEKWMNGILANQQSDGWFGPQRLRTSLDGGPDMWPHMLVLRALRSFQEFSSDPRVVPFMIKYFQFQRAVDPAVFSRSWASLRWGDNLDSIVWLYNRTGESWLLDLAKLIHDHGAEYVSGIPTWHNVNLAQGFREPAQYAMIAGDPALTGATYRDYDTVIDKYGQFPGGGFAGDENCRDGCADPRQGFETCGIVEFMQSFEILSRLTGDPLWADRCEEIAFNSMPAAFDLLQKGTHYITCANCIALDNQPKKHGQFANGEFVMLPYKAGVHDYRCCPHNYGIGWPYFSEELWLASADKGLCASMYAASEVRAKVADGKLATVESKTDYPFEDTVQLTIDVDPGTRFPLYLRIPGWCSTPQLRVNGRQVELEIGSSGILVVDRAWNRSDRVTLRLPMATSIHRWTKNNNAVSVHHGPLAYSLAIHHRWSRYAGDDTWPQLEVTPQSSWNYALVVPDSQQDSDLKISKKTYTDNPFTPDTAPIEIHALARRLTEWKADDDGVVGLLPQSPVKTSEPVEPVMLIPMGAARLRISAFPTVEA